MKTMLGHLSISLLLVGALAGCKQPAADSSSDIPAQDRIDNTAEVEAIAKQANPTQAQVDRYNKDEAEMADAPHQVPADVINTVTFVSENGQSVVATYKKNDTVSLRLADGSTKVLPRAVSGSGARYAADGIEWWEHQGEATYAVNDKTIFAGKLKE